MVDVGSEKGVIDHEEKQFMEIRNHQVETALVSLENTTFIEGKTNY